jgi:gp16 family phage-associated protein
MKAPSQIKKDFEAEGISVAQWAREHGYKAHLVYNVVNGLSKYKRGESHRIAVALGIKQDPSGKYDMS